MTPSAASSSGTAGPPISTNERPRRSRAFRWAVAIGSTLVGVVVVALVAIRQPAVGTWLANVVLSRVAVFPRASARVDLVRGDWIGELELRGLRVTRGDTLLAGADTLRARYRAGELLAGRLHVTDLALAGVRVTGDARDTTRTPPKGPPLTLGQMLQGRFYTGLPLRIDRLSVARGEIGGHADAPDTGFRLTRLALRARDLQLGHGFGFRVDSLAGGLHPGGGRRDSVSFDVAVALAGGRVQLGRLRFLGDSSDVEGHGELSAGARDTLAGANLTLRAQPLSFSDLAGFVPGFPLSGALFADVDLRGTRADRLSGRARARIDRARFGGFALDAFTLAAELSEGEAEARADARIAGATITVRGSGTPLASAPRYALDLRADRLPARLPGMAWWEPLASRFSASLALSVNGAGYAPAVMDVTARVDGDAGMVSVDAHTQLGQPEIDWELRSLAFERLDVARIVGVNEPSAFQGRVSGRGSVARDGNARADAELSIGASSFGTAHVRAVAVRGHLEGASLSGSLHLDSDAGVLDVGSFAVNTAPGGMTHVREARFRDVDLSRLLGSPGLSSRLAGSLSVEASDLSRPSVAPGAMRSRNTGPSADAKLDLGPSTFRGQAVERGSARVVLDRGDARASIELTTAAGVARLTARGQPFARPATVQIQELRFQAVDLAVWTGRPALSSDLTGVLTGAFHARAGVEHPARGSAALDLGRSRLGGAKLEGGQLRAVLGEDHAQLEGSIRTSGSALALHANVSRQDRRTEGTLSCDIPFALLAAVAGRDTLPSRGSVSASARFAAEPGTPVHADGGVTGSGAVGRSRLDTLAASFRLERGLLRVDTLLARSNLATVRGGGRVVLDRVSGRIGSDLALHIVAGDVSPLKELLRADTVALASGSLNLRLQGSDSVRTIALDGTVRSLAWNGLRLSGAELSSAGDLDRNGRPSQGTALVSLRQLQGLSLPIREASAEAHLDGSRLSFVVAASADSRSSARVHGLVVLDSVETTVTLDSLAVRSDTAAWLLTKPGHLTLSSTRFRADEIDIRSRGGRLTIRGGIDRRGDQDLDVVLQRVTIPALATWVGRRDLTGHVDGHFGLRGAAAVPNGDGVATLSLYTAGQPAGTVTVRCGLSGRRAGFEGAFVTPRADSLSCSAVLPFTASLAIPAPGAAAEPAFEGPVHVRVRAQHFPLASLAPFLDPLAVGTPSGTLDVNAKLDGNERALAGGGSLTIAGGAFPLPALGVNYRDLSAHMEFDGDRLVFRDLNATSGKGTLEATGEVRFASVSRVEPKVHVKARKFVFANSTDLKTTASCDVDVSGTLAAPVVKGSVTVLSSSLYFMQPDLQAEAGSEVKLTPADVRMMEETFGYVAPRAPALPLELYDASDLELAIKMERDNWVRQRVPPKMAVALTGDFRLRKRPHADPELFGKIEPIPNRGYVQQFARSFDITGGDVLLNGKMNDHAVNIHAQFKPESGVESQNSSDVVVKLDVEGTPDHLKLTLSSEPPMSEAEIVNFIATGRSTVASPSATTGSSEASLLKDIGMSQLTGLAESAAQEAVGLDVLEVRYDPLRGATLVAGRYVDPQLYVGFRSPLDYNQNTSPNTSNSTLNSTAFEVEYAISRWLVFNCQGETAKLRSFFRARYAY